MRERERLERAPAFEKATWPADADAGWLRDLHSYDGFAAAPRAPGTDWPAGPGEEAAAPETDAASDVAQPARSGGPSSQRPRVQRPGGR